MALSVSPEELVSRGSNKLLNAAAWWERVPLAEIADVQNGFPFPSEEFSPEVGFPVIRIRDVARGSTQTYFTGEFDPAYVVAAGDLIIGMDGDFRRAFWPGPDALLNQRVCRIVLRAKVFDCRFLYHCLQPYLTAINEVTSSVTVKHLSSKAVASIPLPLPPLHEQRRIVERIETLFAEIDKGVESLRAARTALGLYRQSLLKSAFEGRLTANWRAANPDKLETPDALLARIKSEREALYESALAEWRAACAAWEKSGRKEKKPTKPKLAKPIVGNVQSEIAERSLLPDGWQWLPLVDLGPVRGGLTKNAKRNAHPRRVPYLRVANVYADRLELAEVTEIGVTDDELERTSVETGDLLFVEGNGSVDQIGRVAVWNGAIPLVSHQNHLIRFTSEGVLLSRFALQFMLSPLGRKAIVAEASSTSGLHTLSISKIEGLPVPLCSPIEQAEIVRLLDQRLSAADVLGEEIEAGLKRADTLRQSILTEAFAGRLVPQDPDDEPAAVLLERIRTEQAAKPKRGRRAKKSEQTEELVL